MTELEALHSRHSVRKYQDRPLDESVVSALKSEIEKLNREGNLNMQLVLNERKAFHTFLAYGKFSNVANYVLIIGKKSESLDFRAGYYGERLMLFAQSIGMNTCCVGLTYKKVSGTFAVADDEKIVMCISIGYGEDQGVASKSKRPDQISNISAETPDWFRNGVEASLLAPTAVNQQNFYFRFVAPDKVKPEYKFSLVGYSKIDLGIAMYNFEIGAGVNNFKWIDSPL